MTLSESIIKRYTDEQAQGERKQKDKKRIRRRAVKNANHILLLVLRPSAMRRDGALGR